MQRKLGIMFSKKRFIGAMVGIGLITAPILSSVPAYAETTTESEVPAPADLKTTGQTVSAVSLTWNPVINAPQYRIQISAYPDMRDAGYVRSAEGVTSAEARGLSSNTTYYFKVRAITTDGENIGPYSSVLEVKTLPAPALLPPIEQPLSVASYNIKCANCGSGDELSWNDRKDAVISAIKKQSPDILGTQEASQGWVKDSNGVQIKLSQFEDLKNGLVAAGTDYELTNSKRNNCVNDATPVNCVIWDQGASQGTKILYNKSTMELLAAGSKKLPSISEANNARYMAWGTFLQKSTGNRVFFVDTHLEPTSGDDYYILRKQQAETIKTEIASKNVDNLPVIIVGDMNSSKWNIPDNTPYDVFVNAGYLDPIGNTYAETLPSGTGFAENVINANYSSFNGFQRYPDNIKPAGSYGSHLDYIFTSKMRMSEWKMALELDENGYYEGVIPSDHNMITAKVELPNTASNTTTPIVQTPLAIKGEAAKGALGVKIGGEVYTPDKTSGYQKYEKGFIVWSKNSGAWISKGEIRNRWAISGYDGGFLGFPKGDEVATPTGSYQKYENGYILWSAASGAHTSVWPIRSAFAREGYETGRLGYPTGEVVKNGIGGSYQKYRNGFIIESPETGAHISQGVIRSAWAKTGYEGGTLGYPTTDEYKVTGGIAQKFQKGIITVNTATRLAKVTYN